MNIAYLMGTSTSSALEALYGDPKKRQETSTEGSVHSWQQDSVSISAEALALAYSQKTEDQTKNQSESQNAESEDAGMNTTASGGSSGGSGTSIQKLEARIKELQQEISKVQSSNIPEESKNAIIGGLQAELEAALQELNALKNQAA